jgi:ABC-type transport system involved in cytochrome bd biosynthesis fused ATPase/permease subunit
MIKTRLLKLLSSGKKYIAYNIIWQWLALISQIVSVFQIGRLAESVYKKQIDTKLIGISGVIFIVVIVVRFVCEKQIAKYTYKASVDVKITLRKAIYEKMLRLGSNYREKVSTSEVMQVATEGVEQLEVYFGKYISQLIYSLLAPITLFIVLCRINLSACIVLLVCVPLIPMSIVFVQKIAKKLLSKYWGSYTQLGDSFLENLQGLTTLKIYQADEKKSKEMDEEAQRFRKITMKVLTMQLNSTSVMDIIAYGGAAVGMIVTIVQYFNGNVSISGAITIILLASEFFIPLRLLGSYFHIAMNGMAASDKIFAILDLPEESSKDKLEISDCKNIKLENVEFSYDESRKILAGINMELEKGKFISIVGESGCGKSTIAGLILGKNKNYKGSIRIDETELTDINEQSLMEQIILVSHNSYLFKGTVEENLKMGKSDATKEEMEAALRKVNLLDFINSEEGLNTKIAEQGSNLSGGQCQRLAMARAILKDAKMYIFDEATSNIDAESEELIMEVIHKLALTKTIILISHRLANVVNSDCIYMLKNGKITEKGNHSELMNKKGDYFNIFNSQKLLETYGKEAM